jgi:hypothetical protein
MTYSADLIAILRTGEETSAVWHVDVSPSTPLMRLCGAWVSDETELLTKVVKARLILPFGGRLDDKTTEFAAVAAGVVDAESSLAVIREAVTELDAKHRASKTAGGQQRAPIRWPDLPSPLDWAALPPAPRGVNPEPFVAEMIAVARWVADLADLWSTIETTRTSRQHLADGDVTPRPLPVVLVERALS